MRVTVIVALALCLAAVAAGPANPQRIVGGSLTTISQYPMMAALLRTDDGVNFRQQCGGSVINNRAVLTAAHCTINTANNRWRFRVGSSMASSGGVVHTLNAIVNHPQYNSNTFNNDVAVIRTGQNIVYNNNVRAVPIPGTNYHLADNQVVWAAGWGLTSEWGSPSEQLRHVQIWTVNQAVCRERNGYITDNMLCSGWLDVGGRDQCNQDSGGPLLHNGIVVGVSSFGIGCGRPRHPGVNARVSRFTNWILQNS